jgi:hypothetical protein
MTRTELQKLVTLKCTTSEKRVSIEDTFFEASMECIKEFHKSGSLQQLRIAGQAARVSLLATRDSYRYGTKK